MLEMTHINYIKDLREREGLSISEIARKLEIHWITAKKYADGDVRISNEGIQRRERPAIGPYEHLLEAWLEEDLRMPRKQRRTARAMYNLLKKLTSYNGSERTVRIYVQKIRKKLIEAHKEQFVRLTHSPAEAQVDFGEFKAIDAVTESIVKLYFLAMSFPYSNAQLCRVVPSENNECFLEAMKDMFEEIEGVPRTIWFDNLSAAVVKVLGNGKRELTKSFKEFEWYYRFKACFCNVDSPNEKGHAEGKIGYIRRNWLSPMPIIKEIPTFNSWLQKEMINDRERNHSSKNKLISDLWIEDQNALLLLPTQPHEVITTDRKITNKYSEIKINENIYHIPRAHPGQNLFLKKYWDKIEIYDEYGENKISEHPRKYTNQVDKIDWQAELKIFTTKPRAIEHATYLKALPKNIRTFLLVDNLSDRKKRVKTLIELLDSHSITEIEQAAAIGIKEKKFASSELITIINYQISRSSKKPVDESWTPESVKEWQPGLSDYNELCQELIY